MIRLMHIKLQHGLGFGMFTRIYLDAIPYELELWGVLINVGRWWRL
jgi:hypothetical protein